MSIRNMSDMKIIINTGVKDHAFTILKRFNIMRQEEKLCDFIIKAGTQNIKVHRDILAAGSDYFYAMFFHDTLEKKNGIVELKRVSISAVVKCIDYIYTGEFETSVDELDELFFVVNMMQLHTLQQRLSGLLKSHLDPMSFMKIRHVALKYGLKELGSDCDMFALENLDLLMESGSMELFEFEYMSFLLSSELLLSNGYNEDAKLLIAVLWIKADVESRSDKLIPLAKLLKLEKISRSHGKYLIETEEICYESAEFMKMMYLSGSNAGIRSIKPSFHRCVGDIAILDFDKGYNSCKLHLCKNGDFFTESIHLKSASPIMKDSSFVAVCDDIHVFVLASSKSVYALDLESLTWQAKNPMVYSHKYHMRATFDCGHIYVCGSQSMEEYVIAEDKWKMLDTDIYKPCYEECELITYESQVMTIGGIGTGTDVNVLNTTTYNWSKFPSLVISRRTPAAVVYEKSIFVFGGYEESRVMNQLEYYDATTKCWTALPQANHAHDEFRIFVLQERLYTLGGRLGFNKAESYDIVTKKWTDCKFLNKSHKQCVAVALSRTQVALTQTMRQKELLQ